MTADRWRAGALARLAAERFDLLVIGGGITGAGIARDAALRGLRTALVEQQDFAAGTSSRSSRLIHGGVRYLEHGHLHLVFEASRERRILLRMAPHLVRPLAFTWPVYTGARIGRLKLAAGLALYDTLALFRNVARHHRLDVGKVLAAEPGLRRDGLRGGARYFDAATNDARLTLANAIAASEAGACVLTYACVTAMHRDGDRLTGVTARDAFTDQEVVIRARALVNATGPWSDRTRRLVDESAPGTLLGSKGAHIAVPRDRLGNAGAVVMLHPRDGRVLFALPAGKMAIVGTTETPADARPSEVRATAEDVHYLLDAANTYFPGASLAGGDVVAAWAGIRPLAAGLAGSNAGSASREHAITVGEGGMLSVTGGKLTTYREMAEQVVDRVVAGLPDTEPSRCRTAELPLPGGEQSLATVAAAAAADVGDHAASARLAGAFGTRWKDVWRLGESDGVLREPISVGLPYIGAEFAHGVQREMACTLGDLLIRRTHAAFETADQALSLAPKVAAIVAPLLGWDAARVSLEQRRYEREVGRIFGARRADGISR